MTMDIPRGLIFVMVGPGGTGKNTLMNRIMNRRSDVNQLATATTRAMRPNEQQGREHIFVTPEEFRELIATDALLEHQEVTKDKYYGILRASVEDKLKAGQFLIADIEVLGAKILHDTYPDDTVLIFVTVPGSDEDERLALLRQRMEQRIDGQLTENDERLIQERIARARDLEFPFEAECDIVVVNDDLDLAEKLLNQYVDQRIAERTIKVTKE